MRPGDRLCAALDFPSWREAEPFARAVASNPESAPLVGIKTYAQLLPSRGASEEFRDMFSRTAGREIGRILDLAADQSADAQAKNRAGDTAGVGIARNTPDACSYISADNRADTSGFLPRRQGIGAADNARQ